MIRYSTAIPDAGIAALDQRGRGGRHRLGLGRFVGMLVERRRRAVGQHRGQPQPVLRRRSGRAGDDPVGQGDHLRGRPVVPLQPDDGGVRVLPVEAEQVAGRGTGEGVDRLVGIPDDGQLIPPTEPGVQRPLLQRGDVLVLVDDETPVAGTELAGDLLVVLEHGAGVQQQVVEVQLLGLAA